jgi:hypothetical protein
MVLWWVVIDSGEVSADLQHNGKGVMSLDTGVDGGQ